jgi:hypothetical protein
MRVFTSGLLLTTAIISIVGFGAMPARANQTKVTCLCDCPDDHKVKPRHAEAPPAVIAPRRVARRAVRPYAQAGYYNYRAAAPISPPDWHGEWRVAPNDGLVPGPAPVAYYAPPPPVPEPQGLQIDDRGWTGGVGNTARGGGGGGGGSDYSQVQLAQGGNAQNGPNYNSYSQSFQSNPSVAGPFQNRLMGGLAPTTTTSK